MMIRKESDQTSAVVIPETNLGRQIQFYLGLEEIVSPYIYLACCEQSDRLALYSTGGESCVIHGCCLAL